jgi:hypothetical protein
MAGELPRTVHLPSGLRVQLDRSAAASAARDAERGGPFAEALAILEAPGVLSGAGGEPLDVYTLPLRDVHTLRALLARAGHTREEAGEFTCENCGAPFECAPSSLLEVGPFVDGELSDPDLDAPFPFGEPLPIPRISLPAARPPPRRVARLARPAAPRAPKERTADTVTFAERTAGDARALFRVADALFTGRARSLRITPGIVVGMGVVALGAERRTSVLAEALSAASNAAWASVIDCFHDAAYPPRLFAVHRCAACGARNDLDVPLARELEREPALREGQRASARGARPPFPDLDAFESMVRAHADRIYAARGLRNIDLFVDAGVPHCDEGGEPLLGSYLPGGVDEGTGVPRAPEVRVYYRTFESEYAHDPSFDVDAEIEETIDHELEHHLHHLAGFDPLDEEEHATIDAEEIRRIGTRETARRGRQALWSDAAGAVRAMWPLWVAMLLAALLLWWSR